MMPDPVDVASDPIAPQHVVDPVVVDPPAPAQPTVADLLAQSQRAHLLYHQESPRMAAQSGALPVMQPGNPAAAREWIKQAAASRAQAELIDPTHSDPAWADEPAQFPHQELLVFYLQQLSR